jgi:hypothetical protein
MRRFLFKCANYAAWLKSRFEFSCVQETEAAFVNFEVIKFLAKL